MLISGMNRFFERHGRWVLLTLTVLLAITFISFFTAGTGGSGESSAQNDQRMAAKVFGDVVSVAEYQRHNSYIAIATFLTENQGLEIYRGALGIAAYRTAQNLGITVSKDEIRDHIKTIFSDVNGVFQKATYKNYMEEVLPRNGFTPGEFDEAVAHLLTIQKLYNGPIINVQGPNTLLVDLGKSSREVFETEVAWFYPWQYLKTATVTDTQIESTYNLAVERYNSLNTRFAAIQDSVAFIRNMKRQTEETYKQADNAAKQMAAIERELQSAKVNVPMTSPIYDITVAAFPLENATIATQTKVKPAELENFYLNNLSRYNTTDSVRPLEDVIDTVRADFLRNRVRSEVIRNANVFAETIAGGDALKANAYSIDAFKKLAETSGAKCSEAAKFSYESSDLPGEGTVFQLHQVLEKAVEQQRQITGVAVGFKSAYVAFIKKVEPARVKTLAEAKSEIKEKLIGETSNTLAESAAQKFAADAMIATTTNGNVDSIAGGKWQPLAPFAMNADSMPQDPTIQAVAYQAFSVAEGKTSKAFDVNGSWAVLRVKKITPPSAESVLTDSSMKTMFDNITRNNAMYELLQWLQANTEDYVRVSGNNEGE